MANMEDVDNKLDPVPAGHKGTEALKMTFRPAPVAHVPKMVGTGAPKSIDEVAAALGDRFGKDSVHAVEKEHKGDPFVVVDGAKIAEILKFLRDDERYLCTMLNVVSATDYPVPEAPPAPKDGAAAAPAAVSQLPGAANGWKTFPRGFMAVVYVVTSFVHKHQIMVKVHIPREGGKVPTVSDIYRCANWYERECFDMLGMTFEGHPNHNRILLPPDWVGYPLRKDYVFPQDYNGMKVPL